jgi:hypothetical protein
MIRTVASGMSPISARCHQIWQHAMVLKCIRTNVFYPVHAKHLLVRFIMQKLNLSLQVNNYKVHESGLNIM